MNRTLTLVFATFALLASFGQVSAAKKTAAVPSQQQKQSEIQKVQHQLLQPNNQLGRLFNQNQRKKTEEKPAPKVVDLRPPSREFAKAGNSAEIQNRKILSQSDRSTLFSKQLFSRPKKSSQNRSLELLSPNSKTATNKNSVDLKINGRTQRRISNELPAAASSNIQRIYSTPYHFNPLRQSSNFGSQNSPATRPKTQDSLPLRSSKSMTDIQVTGSSHPGTQSTLRQIPHRKPVQQDISLVKTPKRLTNEQRNPNGSYSIKVSGKKLVSGRRQETRNLGPTLTLSNPHNRRPLGEVIQSPNLDPDDLTLEEFSTKRKDNLAADPVLTEEDMRQLRKRYKESAKKIHQSTSQPKVSLLGKTNRSKESAIQNRASQLSKQSANQVIQVSGEFGPSFLDLIFDLDQLGTDPKQLAKRFGPPVKEFKTRDGFIEKYAVRDGLVPTAIYRDKKLQRIDFVLKDPEVWSTVKHVYGLAEFPVRETSEGRISLPDVNLLAVALDNPTYNSGIGGTVVEKFSFLPGFRERFAMQEMQQTTSGNKEIASSSRSEDIEPSAKLASSRVQKSIQSRPRKSEEMLLAYDVRQSRNRITKLGSQFGQSEQTLLEEVHYHNLRHEFHLASNTLERLNPQFLTPSQLLCFYYEQATCQIGTKNYEEAVAAISSINLLKVSASVESIRKATEDYLRGRVLVSVPKAKKVFDRNCRKAVKLFGMSIKELQKTTKLEDQQIRRLAGILFVMNHAYQGKAIALGPFQNREEASKLWYQYANTLAHKMAKKGSASSILQLAAQRVAVETAIEIGDVKSIQLALNNLHSKFADIRFKLDPIDRDQLSFWLAEDYYQASFQNYRIDELTQATRLHRQTERFLKTITKVHSKDQKIWLDYCYARNHWLKGAIIQKHRKTNTAADWFNKSLKIYPNELTPQIVSDQAEQGERFANMAVTFWKRKQHQKAISLTGRGLELIQECVSLGKCSASRILIPESNFVQMQEELALLNQSKSMEVEESRQFVAESKSQPTSSTKVPIQKASSVINQTNGKTNTIPITKKPVNNGTVPIVQPHEVPASAWRPKN